MIAYGRKTGRRIWDNHVDPTAKLLITYNAVLFVLVTVRPDKINQFR